MKTKTEEFEVLIPNLDGTGIGQRVKVPITLEWDEEVQQWLVTPESHELIDRTKARLIGLLLPDQLKELRERYDYTQKEMGELFQVGEKSWTRWESGKHRPSRSINLLIRALYEGEISINYLLKRAGKPARKTTNKSAQFAGTNITNWLMTMLESCQPSVESVYPEKIANLVSLESKADPEENDFHIQIAKLAFEELGQAELRDDAGVSTSSKRYVMSTPTHVYKQPRLANHTPTEA
jgi:transcriptional regulator with XRE-family HTH domain